MSTEHNKYMEKPDRIAIEQQDKHSPEPHNLLLFKQQLLLKSYSTPTETIESENEEMIGHQHENSSGNSDNSLSIFGSRLDDEDPIFTLDEEDRAKELLGERTRHYTADFDPTASDDDEFAKEIGNLHGGRAYSTSNRFPPRVRHSGRTGNLPNTGVLYQLHGQNANGPVVPASLPIQISRGFIWPPRDLVDSLSEEEDSIVDTADKTQEKINIGRGRTKTVSDQPTDPDIQTSPITNKYEQHRSSEREDNMYGRIRAYSRSIQPDDDPERIFGERPHRRYSTSLKYGGVDPDYNVDENGEMVNSVNNSGGENIPPVSSIDPISPSVSLSGRASVGGTVDSSSTATTPRVIMQTGLLSG